MFPQITYPIVIWGLYAGVVFAAIAATVARFTTGRAVKALLTEGATSPENAKTAAELDLSGASARALRGSLYGKLFVCANEKDAAIKPKKKPKEYKKPRLDMSKAKFYLPKDKEFQAKERFPRPSIVSLVVGLVLLTVIFVLLRIFLPSIVEIVISAFSFSK